MTRGKALFTLCCMLAFALGSPWAKGLKDTDLDKGLLFEKWHWERVGEAPKVALVKDEVKATLEDLLNIVTLEAVLNDPTSFTPFSWKGKIGGEAVIVSSGPAAEIKPGIRFVVLSRSLWKSKMFVGTDFSAYLEARIIKKDEGQWVYFRQPFCVKDAAGNLVRAVTGKPCEAVNPADSQAITSYLLEHADELKFAPFLISVPINKSVDLGKAPAETGGGALPSIPPEALSRRTTWKKIPIGPEVSAEETMKAMKKGKEIEATCQEIMVSAALETVGAPGKVISYSSFAGKGDKEFTVVGAQSEEKPAGGLQYVLLSYAHGEGVRVSTYLEILIARQGDGGVEAARIPLCKAAGAGPGTFYFSDEACWAPRQPGDIPRILDRARKYHEETNPPLTFLPLKSGMGA